MLWRSRRPCRAGCFGGIKHGAKWCSRTCEYAIASALIRCIGFKRHQKGHFSTWLSLYGAKVTVDRLLTRQCVPTSTGHEIGCNADRIVTDAYCQTRPRERIAGEVTNSILKTPANRCCSIDDSRQTPRRLAFPCESHRRNYLVCLEDGKRYKTLKRTLALRLGLSPDEYRAKWGLPSDYPMVAPNYSKARSELAKQIGLGGRVTKPACKRRTKR